MAGFFFATNRANPPEVWRDFIATRKEKPMEADEAATEVLVSQLEIARQSIEDRDRRIWELQKRVELLEGMLNRLGSQGFGVPQPQPLPAYRNAPRRWSVK
jgi:hypothetical protein